MLTRRSPFLPYAAVCMLAVACASSTEPAAGAEAGRYVAVTAGGRTLPTVTDTAALEFSVLLADTLDLDGHGGARRAFAIRRARPPVRIDTVYRITADVQYRRLGTRVEVGSFTPCPANAVCVANDTGTISADRITLTAYRYGAGARVELVRLAP